MSSTDFLDRIHERVLPRTYAEIGVFHGKSLARALPGTQIVGIDPAYDIRCRIDRRAKLFRSTSDDFFSTHDLSDVLGAAVDLAFIDGMHLFEYALRDFINIERHAHSDTVVLIDDCVPPNERAASRERSGSGPWCGDVWKLPLALRSFRPDLDVVTFATQPSGTAMVQCLDSSSKVLEKRFSEIVTEYDSMGYAEFTAQEQLLLPWTADQSDVMESLVRAAPLRTDDPTRLRWARTWRLPTPSMAVGIVKDKLSRSAGAQRTVSTMRGRRARSRR